MKKLVLGMSLFVAVICLVLCAVMYVDNRALLRQIAEKSSGCISTKNYESIIMVSETLADVNRRDQAILRRLREVHDIGRDQAATTAQERRRRGDGQIWRAAGDDRPKNNGRGGGGG